MRAPPLELIVELARSVEAADPFAFQFAEQAYLFRHEDGSFETGVFPWSEAVLEDLASLERATASRCADAPAPSAPNASNEVVRPP